MSPSDLSIIVLAGGEALCEECYVYNYDLCWEGEPEKWTERHVPTGKCTDCGFAIENGSELDTH